MKIGPVFVSALFSILLFCGSTSATPIKIPAKCKINRDYLLNHID